MLKKIMLSILCMLSIIATAHAGLIVDMIVDVNDEGSSFRVWNTSIIEEHTPTIIESDGLRVHMYASVYDNRIIIKTVSFEKTYSGDLIFLGDQLYRLGWEGGVIKLRRAAYNGAILSEFVIKITPLAIE